MELHINLDEFDEIEDIPLMNRKLRWGIQNLILRRMVNYLTKNPHADDQKTAKVLATFSNAVQNLDAGRKP